MNMKSSMIYNKEIHSGAFVKERIGSSEKKRSFRIHGLEKLCHFDITERGSFLGFVFVLSVIHRTYS